MRNFNTNQTRQLYVATTVVDETPAAAGQILLGTALNGDLYFQYMNADGLLTRSDTFNKERIIHLHKGQQPDGKLLEHTVAIDTSAVTLSDLVGKTLNCSITVSEVFDYDASNTVTFTATVVGNSTNTATAAAFHKALAYAIAQAMPTPDKKYPWLRIYSNGTEVLPTTAEASITGASGGVVLKEVPQKYVRGKLTGEPVHFDVSFSMSDGNLDDIVWGTDTVAVSQSVVPGAYALADLEYFALGERGDYYRGSEWPNEVITTYMVNPNSASPYYVLSIEYYWQGCAENVQKSPRMIQVVSTTQATINSLYNAISSGSASGSGTGA